MREWHRLNGDAAVLKDYLVSRSVDIMVGNLIAKVMAEDVDSLINNGSELLWAIDAEGRRTAEHA